MVADWEQLQLQPYDDEEIMTILEEYRIELSKGPASCTNTFGNACYRSRMFKAAKNITKYEKAASAADYQDTALQKHYFDDDKSWPTKIIYQKRNNIS